MTIELWNRVHTLYICKILLHLVFSTVKREKNCWFIMSSAKREVNSLNPTFKQEMGLTWRIRIVWCQFEKRFFEVLSSFLMGRYPPPSSASNFLRMLMWKRNTTTSSSKSYASKIACWNDEVFSLMAKMTSCQPLFICFKHMMK